MVLPNGYTFVSTFPMDFYIAEQFGLDAVRDTYKRAFEENKDDCVYLTELVITLNHGIWRHYESNNEYAELYNELWMEADTYAVDNLRGDELLHFLRVTD